MNKKKLNNKILGGLESEIMEVVWKLKNATVRDVLNGLNRKKKPAYTTVMTVMARLYKKGILKRKMNGGDAYVYTPAQNKENFAAAVSKRIINNLISEFGEDAAVAQFINIMESGDLKKSKEWREKLEKIIK